VVRTTSKFVFKIRVLPKTVLRASRNSGSLAATGSMAHVRETKRVAQDLWSFSGLLQRCFGLPYSYDVVCTGHDGIASTFPRTIMPSATEQFGQQARNDEEVGEMGSNNHNSSSSSIVAWAGACAALLACDCGATLFEAVTSSSEASIAPSRPGRLGLCFLNGEPTALETPLVPVEGLLSNGGVLAVPGPALPDCGVPTEGESVEDFFAEVSDIGSAECCRLS
jgi:hypothetical protein